MKDKKGFEKISGGRMFTAYMSLRGHYASEGDLINEFLRYYNEYKSGDHDLGLDPVKRIQVNLAILLPTPGRKCQVYKGDNPADQTD